MIGVFATCECGGKFLRGIYPQQKCEMCDIKTFNEIWCGGLNDTCDSHYEPEVKPERKPKRYIDEEGRFFGTHIREVIKIFKDMKKSGN